MTDEAADYRSCAVCGRTILRGERTTEYVTPEGLEAIVCELCKPRAEGSGWLPAALTVTRADAGRTRRRRGLGLRERFARVSGAITEVAGARGEAAQNGRTDGESAIPPSQSPPSAPRRPKPTREQTMRRAIQTFNDSPERRKVAGLVRSLGEPSASVLAGANAITTITVGWELSWYQWRVSEGSIEEIAKGTELTELDEEHQAWNATVAADGELQTQGTQPRGSAAA